MFDEPAVFLDLETTGGSAAHDRIIEIGLVELIPGGDPVEWSTLVNPLRSIPPAVQALTGITEDMVARARTFGELAPALRARLEGRLLIAHNAPFDYGFLRREFARANLSYASRVLCTVRLSRRLDPGLARHNLDTLIVHHGIEQKGRHRALGDARVLWQLAARWQIEFGEPRLAKTVAELLAPPAASAHLPPAVLDGIPEAPGYYVLYGKGDIALYAGSGAIEMPLIPAFASEKGVAAVPTPDWAM